MAAKCTYGTGKPLFLWLQQKSGMPCHRITVHSRKHWKHYWYASRANILGFQSWNLTILQNGSLCSKKALQKWWKMLFASSWKIFSFSRYLDFCFDVLVMYQKQFDSKENVSFKSYDITTWLKSNYNTHVSQYLTK